MKKVVTLLSLNTLLLLSSCSSGITKIEAEELFTYSNDIIMPIEDGERMILSGYVIYNQNETLNNVRLFERTYILYEGEYISFASGWINGTVAEVHKNDVIPYSFIVPESDNSASYGLKVELSVRNFDTQEYYDTRTLKVVTKLHTYINPEEYRLFPLTINRLTRGDGKEVEESFLFNNINEIIDPSYYLRIMPSIFSFKYIGEENLSIKKASLSFIDIYNLFPHIHINSGLERYIELIPLQEEDTVTFKFSTLYIDTDNYDMSTSPRGGYISTKYLYLPRNKQDLMDNYTFFLNIEEMGLNGINIRYEMAFNSNHLLLGSCHDASYCIVGGEK